MERGNPPKHFVIRLGSKGLCFICLRDATIVEDHGTDGDDPPEVRLQNITHFLGIDTKSILKNYFACELSKCEGLEVKLCGKCSSLMDQFSSLYQTLEVTRLKLNQCLNRIQELIDEADRDNARVEEMKERVTHGPTAGVLEEMRKTILEKCLRTIKEAPPPVVFERMTCKKPTPDVIPPATEKEDQDNFGEDEEEDGASADSDLESDDNDSVPEPEPSSASKNPASGLPNSEAVEQSCPHCRAVMRAVNPAGRYNWWLNCHLLCYHLEKFFDPEEKYKDESLTSLQFKQILHHFLFQTFAFKRGNSKCPWCPRDFFTTTDWKYLKLHLINEHHDLLCERLRELQKDEEVLHQLKEIRPGHQCKCGAYIVNSFAMREHQNKFCNLPIRKAPFTSTLVEEVQMKRQTSKSKKLFTCSFCGVRLTTRHIKRHHVASHHCEQHFLEYRDPSISVSTFKALICHGLFKDVKLKEGKFWCPYCTKEPKSTFANKSKSRVTLHMIEFHFEELVQQVRKIQSESRKNCEMVGSKDDVEEDVKPFASRSSDANHRMHSMTGGRTTTTTVTERSMDLSLRKIGNDFCCPYCLYNSSAEFVVQRHAISRHCHEYFTQHRLQSVTLEQFQTLVSSVLFKGLVGKDLRCHFCSKQLKYNEKVHLFQNHYEELVERLVALQRDPNILTGLKKEPKPAAAYSSKSGAERESKSTASSKSPCPHCKCRCQPLDRHLMTHHLEKYFTPEEKFNVASLSPHQFRQILYHLLFTSNTKSEQNDRKKCVHCAKSFENDANWSVDLNLHIIKMHFFTLTRRLKQLQRDSQIHEKLANITTGDVTCKCGQYFVSMQKYNSHRTKFCNLLPFSLDEDKQRCCAHCRFKPSVYSVRSLDFHRLRFHLETYFVPEEEFKEPALTSHLFKQVLEHLLFEYIGTSGCSQKCPYCSEMFSWHKKHGPFTLKRHLINSHHELLSQRLRELQKDPLLQEKLGRARGFLCTCGAYFAKLKAYHVHRKRFCNRLSGTTSVEGTAESTGNIPDNSKGSEVDESCMFLSHDDSASEQGRDPLALECESDQVADDDDDEPEPGERDLKPVQVGEFAFATEVEQKDRPKIVVVKINRKRKGSDGTAEA